ncbi:DUF995 domain-containing protein [Agrobacterium sp. Ap1]|uniref:DUF995 domain-containing protein n=1 Tax=Rhizobium/Agrobacterium group TaxID=227290 RepID=UPI001A8FAC1E|nr:DUF995 domain-containing protein [Agrobacterium sp. Ap1]MBO0145096.1 DUF995 domain-containing protein [Agrobacterium sp. Ap1]
MIKIYVIAISTVFAGIAGPANSATLPAGATRLTKEEIRVMYEGKSADWKSVRVFFAPDGSAKLVRKDKKAYGEGHWAVKENEMCLTITPVDVAKGKREPMKDCYAWHKVGTKYYMLWSGDKDKKDAYRDDEPSRLVSGDQVSQDFLSIKK